MTDEKKREAVASAIQAAKSALDNMLNSRPISTGICPCGHRLVIDICFHQTMSESVGTIVRYKVICPECGLEIQWKDEI